MKRSVDGQQILTKEIIALLTSEPQLESRVEVAKSRSFCVEPYGRGFGVWQIISKPQLTPGFFDNVARPHLFPMSRILEVCVEVDQSSCSLLDIIIGKCKSAGAFDKSSQSWNKVSPDVFPRCFFD